MSFSRLVFRLFTSIYPQNFTLPGHLPANEILCPDTLTRYRDLATDSGQQLDRYFCNACGSPIYAVTPLWDEILSIFCGTYDDSERWRPPFKEQYLDCKKFWVPEFGRWKDGVRANGGGEAEGEDEETVASRHARGAL